MPFVAPAFSSTPPLDPWCVLSLRSSGPGSLLHGVAEDEPPARPHEDGARVGEGDRGRLERAVGEVDRVECFEWLSVLELDFFVCVCRDRAEAVQKEHQ